MGLTLLAKNQDHAQRMKTEVLDNANVTKDSKPTKMATASTPASSTAVSQTVSDLQMIPQLKLPQQQPQQQLPQPQLQHHHALLPILISIYCSTKLWIMTQQFKH